DQRLPDTGRRGGDEKLFDDLVVGGLVVHLMGLPVVARRARTPDSLSGRSTTAAGREGPE
ncbi:MAG: hypothetical protein M3N15_07000, partial [Actinomycetota bacterium]|nr:hypothetical protein [Actinomycetota bacterium]